MHSIRNCAIVFKRELKSYFESPVAYVFLVAFLMLVSFLTFSVTRYYERMSADLTPFFTWHPWVYLLLVPAATMSTWAEERKSGTIELLLTLPVTMTQAILGKFFAAWAFIGLGLALTFPVVITTAFLGNPDIGVVIAGYLGSFLLAGAYVSIGILTSSMTRSQVIGFVIALGVGLVLLLAGWEPILGFFRDAGAPNWIVEGVGSLSFMPHFESLRRGVIDLRDVVYYISVMFFMIFLTHMVLENRKSA
ncbi:MAG: ABC transporter permease subunit [Verrucomicrobiota bacterium]